MRKIASYLRRFFLPVLGIVALLVIQAVCDLSLPDYTSKIVNVGIQQGGIENPAPEQIRQSEMEKLLLLVPEESRDAVLEKYTLNTEKDPAVYEQKRLSGKEQEDLNGILEKPIFLVYMLESGQVEGMPGEITPEILQGMEAQGISLDQVMDELDQKLGEMEGSILTQSDILYVQQEYEALGVDVGAIQIQYIVITGLKMLGLALAAMLATIIAPTVGIDVFSPTFVAGLVAVVVISSFGVAGVGGGATFASLIVLGTMGLPIEIVGLLASVEPLIDMGRTALNVSDSMVAGVTASNAVGALDRSVLRDPEARVSSDGHAGL